MRATIGEHVRERTHAPSAKASDPPKSKQPSRALDFGGEGPQVQIATRIPKDLHKRVKLHCLDNQLVVRKFIIDALDEALDDALAVRGV
jgi:hypothetical protein